MLLFVPHCDIVYLATSEIIEELKASVSSSMKWGYHYLLHITSLQGWCESSKKMGL